MSEEFKLVFSRPQPLIDPGTKGNFLDCLYYSTFRIENLGLRVLSPDEQAIENFTSPFVGRFIAGQSEEVAEQNSGGILIQRRINTEEESEHLANVDLVFTLDVIDSFANDQPIIVELDIDPDISPGHSHVYVFTSRGAGDVIKVIGSGNRVECQLYDPQQTDLIRINSLHIDEDVSVTNPNESGLGQFIDKQELEEILRDLRQPLWKKTAVAGMNPGAEQATTLNYNSVTNYALIIKGIGNEVGQGVSGYSVRGRITIRE